MNMKTDDFIRLLASDQAAPPVSAGRGLAIAVAAGFAVSAVLFWITLGPRPDIAAAATTPRFILKVLLCLGLAAAAVVLVTRLIRPGTPSRGPAIALVMTPILLAGAVAVELLVVPSTAWLTNLVGSNSLVCITAIPLLALPLLFAGLYAARCGAPISPATTGAVVGVLAGGLAAALYATQCTDDSPLFVATWYSLSIAAVCIAGAVAGRQALRW